MAKTTKNMSKGTKFYNAKELGKILKGNVSIGRFGVFVSKAKKR